MEIYRESKMIERHNREQDKVVQNQREKEERNRRARPSSWQSIIGTERERRKDVQEVKRNSGDSTLRRNPYR
jgi:hypothetical protein